MPQDRIHKNSSESQKYLQKMCEDPGSCTTVQNSVVPNSTNGKFQSRLSESQQNRFQHIKNVTRPNKKYSSKYPSNYC